MYSEMVMKHFTEPENVGLMKDADSIGVMGDGDCGDQCVIFIKVDEGRIKRCSFLVFGCAPAIASGSMTTVLAQGKTLDEALAISEEDILQALGGLPEVKKHCSNLGAAALHAAVEEYLGKTSSAADDVV